MKTCYILEMKSLCTTGSSVEREHTFDVFPTPETAKKEMRKRAKERLKELVGYRESFESETSIRLDCEDLFFDKNVTWTIFPGNNHME